MEMLKLLVILTLMLSCQSANKNNNSSDKGMTSHFIFQEQFHHRTATTTPTSTTNSNNNNNEGKSSTNDGTMSDFMQTARSKIVETKYGKVQGLAVTLFQHHQGKNVPLKNRVVEVFLGLPYAAPATKSRRFSPTQTPLPWTGIRAAIKLGFVCPQMMPDIRNESAALKEMPKGYFEYLKKVEPFLRNQSEDCLFLNLYRPASGSSNLRPILLFVHGGSFAWGSGNLSDGTILSAYADIIVISINYRLGVLGFLNVNSSPGKPSVSNFGLMDIVASLHWIKEEIKAFGGDPDNVTVMGYEAGAALINYLMSSPTVNTGLFRRAILISGSALAPWAVVSDPTASAISLAQGMNCSNFSSSTSNTSSSQHHHSYHYQQPQSNTAGGTHGKSSRLDQIQQQQQQQQQQGQLDSILDCLKNKHFSYFTKFHPPKFSTLFGPSIDQITIVSNFREFRGTQNNGGKNGNSKKYDLLFGISSLERMYDLSQKDLKLGFESQRRDAILRTLIKNSYRYHLNEILATITNEYIDWEKSAHPVATRDLTITALTDALSLSPVVAAASDMNQISAKSFFYVFEHSTKEGLYNHQKSGAGGGEELNYIFGSALYESMMVGQFLHQQPPPFPSNYTKAEIALSELFMTYISNFVHSGDPNEPSKMEGVWPISKERNRFKNPAWESYDRFHQKYLEIGVNRNRIRSHYRAHQISVWLRLVPELQRSGAQLASAIHNRIREIVSGGDPSSPLYYASFRPTGDVPLLGWSDLNDSTLYFDTFNYPPNPPTTCFSPLSSSISQNINNINRNGEMRKTDSGDELPEGSSVRTHLTNESNSQSSPSNSSSQFSPYSTALSITIAIGCSLLLLNILIFALVYYQRDKKRTELLARVNQLTSSSGESATVSSSSVANHIHSSSSQSYNMNDSQRQSSNKALVVVTQEQQQLLNPMQLNTTIASTVVDPSCLTLTNTSPSTFNTLQQKHQVRQCGIVLSPLESDQSNPYHQQYQHQIIQSSSNQLAPVMHQMFQTQQEMYALNPIPGNAGTLLSKPNPPPRSSCSSSSSTGGPTTTLQPVLKCGGSQQQRSSQKNVVHFNISETPMDYLTRGP